MIRNSGKKSTAKSGNTPSEAAGGVSSLQVERFARLFRGWSKRYGLSDPRRMKRDETGKLDGSSWTAVGEPTLDEFKVHLVGSGYSLGIFMLDDNDNCSFAAMDLDIYNNKLDYKQMEKEVHEKGLPLIVCTTKSGGIHFYVFMREPVEARLVVAKMAEWAAALGISRYTNRQGKVVDIEIFPKQTQRYNDTDVGSWINLPYHNQGSQRHAIIDGKAATLSKFLDVAEGMLVGPELFMPPDVVDAKDDLFYEGPPCLQMLHSQGGFAEGSRNDGMMAVVTYCKKRWPDNWQSKVDEFNQDMTDGLLGSKEVQGIIKSFEKKDYAYACKKSPISAVCQRKVCLTRMYGVGEGSPESHGCEITNLLKYEGGEGDEPMWGMDVNNKRVLISNTQFYSKDEFNKICMAQVSEVPIAMPPARWQKWLGDMVRSASVVQLPEEATASGRLWTYIEQFCQNKARAQTWEEMTLGKPRFENGRMYFRSQDLFAYLDARKVEYRSTQAVYMFLKGKQAERGTKHLVGTTVNWWSLPVKEKTPMDKNAMEIDLGSEEF